MIDNVDQFHNSTDPKQDGLQGFCEELREVGDLLLGTRQFGREGGEAGEEEVGGDVVRGVVEEEGQCRGVQELHL